MWRHGKDYGGHLAGCMIGSTIMNRVKLGWGNLLEVLERLPNFSATYAQPAMNPASIWEPQFVKLLHEVEGIYDGTIDYSKGALYWGDLRQIETDFFKNKILGQAEIHPRICELNSLAFFR